MGREIAIVAFAGICQVCLVRTYAFFSKTVFSRHSVPNSTQEIMPKKTISKRKVSHLSYIVSASGTDQWITPEDLEVARIQRDAQYVYARGDDVTINGFHTAANKERGDRNMTHQFMAYLASTAVTPMEANTPFCCAFAHTSNLTPVATVDRTCMSFRAPHLAFDTDKFLKQVMTEETRDNYGMFAPFAAKHVKKVLRIVPNMEILTPNGIAGKYHVEMCILTGMGILVARGHLHIPRDQMETVEKMHVGSIKFTGCHINWHTWGFDAERRWVTPWKLSCVGHPFS